MRWGAVALLVSACAGGSGEPDAVVHDAGLPDQPMLQSPIDMRQFAKVVAPTPYTLVIDYHGN